MNDGVLRNLSSRLASWITLRGALVLAGAIMTAALAALLADAALDLSEPMRVATPWLLAAGSVGIMAAFARGLRRLTGTRVAQLFERTNPSLGNRLTNAVQLGHTTAATAVGEFLRREAVEFGRAAAAGVHAWPVARRGVRRAALAAMSALAAWGLVALTSREMLTAVVPRFADPRGDHPPYSQLKIEVSPRQVEVLYGGQLEVRATVSGRPVDKLWLVAQAGNNATRAIMFLAPDKSFFQTLANLREPGEFFVTDGRARSHRFPVKIRTTPQITLVEQTAEFPAYTAKPPRTAKLADEPQALPADTKVSFRVASNRPLKSGSLTLTPVLGGKPVEVALRPEAQDTIVGGGFMLTDAMAFTLTVRDVDGLDCAEPRRGRFNLLPDERPRLHVLEPGRNAVATPSIRVPVRVQAEDDYGVERVVWLRGHNRSIERPFNMQVTLKSGPQSVEAAGAFDLEKLGVRPGDVIDYYFEATDNYPRGPNVALSRLYRLQVISKEQYEQILRAAAARKALFEPYFKLGAWLRRLAERASNAAAKAQSGANPEATQKEAAELAEELAMYQGELEKLLDTATMFDIEQSFRETLVTQHTRVEDAHQQLKKKAQGGGKVGAMELAELARALSELSKAEQEEVTEPARQIASVAQLLARSDEFVKLAQQQAALAQLLRRFADKRESLSRTEQMEVQELAHQQRRVQEGLRRLLQTLPELLAKVPDEPQYESLRSDVSGFLEAVAAAKIEDDLVGAVKSLGEPDTMTGYALAQSAADKMDKLIGKCNDLAKQGSQCLRFRPSVQKGLGNTLGQILAAMGANSGQGGSGREGYGLFNEDVGLYGPNMELAGEQGGGREEPGGAGPGGRFTQVPGDARDPGLPAAGAPGRVRVQADARFPLRYRELVGEYFRAIAESGTEEGAKK